MDITIGKRMTINTGNYSSIQPTVSVTLKNIEPDEYKEKVEAIMILTDAIFTKCTMEDADWMQHIKDHGLKRVLDSINIEQMTIETENALDTLRG